MSAILDRLSIRGERHSEYFVRTQLRTWRGPGISLRLRPQLPKSENNGRRSRRVNRSGPRVNISPGITLPSYTRLFSQTFKMLLINELTTEGGELGLWEVPLCQVENRKFLNFKFLNSHFRRRSMALLNKQSIIGNYWKIVQFIFKTGSYSYLLDTASISLQPQLIIEKKIGSEKSQHEGSYLVLTGEPHHLLLIVHL